MAKLARAVAEPIVKWPGGKSRLLAELVARLPRQWNRYYEPFAGGAALFFRIAPRRSVLADLIADLIAMYRGIVDDLDGVARHLRRYKDAHSERHYYATRDAWNTRRTAWSGAKRAATFIYLNKTCFNGLWRVNRAGAFNVPLGRYTNPTIFMPETLRAAREVLARTELRTGDYRAALGDAGPGDLVYLDPPYHPVSATSSFTSYTAGSFGADDQRALADTARELAARGCHVVLSNSNTGFVRSLYEGFRIDRVRCSRSINSVATGRGEIDELIITKHAKQRVERAMRTSPLLAHTRDR